MHTQFLMSFLLLSLFYGVSYAETAMINIKGRKCTSLNGKWQVIIDPTGIGNWRQVWLEKKPQKKTDFFEYSFEGGPTLNVPGDFNTQMPELTYVEGTIWYKKIFSHKGGINKRYFIHFGAVNYQCDVYLNGQLLGSHEGGFTPFQFEIGQIVREGENSIVVKVNNQRVAEGIPSLGYDWFNYGGITRDVDLVETPESYIEDYFIQLKKNSFEEVFGYVKINGVQPGQELKVEIPELKKVFKSVVNKNGIVEVKFKSKFKLWSPEDPKLYKLIISAGPDTVVDDIGFRTIEAKKGQVLLNGKVVFFKAVNIHEENPFKAAKAYSEDDARLLIGWAKELGCNMVRLAHYPHNEYMVKLAEKSGIMVWDEIPVYQHIEFKNQKTALLISQMMKEMVHRDKNRCAVVIWSLSNETYHFTPKRDSVLVDITRQCKAIDSSRLITHVINTQGYTENIFDVWDTLYRHSDIISINEYIGWYVPWQGRPEDVKWKLVCSEKPVMISEFGGEALYGSNYGPKDEAAFWSEEYQEEIYKKQVTLFGTIPNLVGVCPWLLVDYRSMGRLHPVFQQGWNRKGVLSEKGEKKKAWYILKSYYESK